jgi:type III secretion translocon protein HrpF
MQFNPSRPTPPAAPQVPPQDPTSIIPGADAAPATSTPTPGVGLDAPTPEQTAVQLQQQEADAALQGEAQAASMEAARQAADKAMVKTNQNQTLHVLSMHLDKLPKKMKEKDINKLLDDPNTPPDLKKELQNVKDNKDGIRDLLDTAGKGGDADGTISHDDIKKAAEDPSYQKYCKEKSKAGTQSYIPSDDPSQAARVMTAADAFRELYLYADSLPDGIDKEELEDIASGKSKGKTPPQVMAAAQFLLDNPDALKKILPPGGHLDNNEMEDTLVKHINLNPAEQKALATMAANSGVFFKDGKKLTREELEKIANDPAQPPAVRQTAQLLIDDPVLFGMLDSAKGHGGNLIKKGNDAKISKEDLALATKNLTAENKAAPAKHVLAAAPVTATDVENLQEMANGTADDPNIKKSSGGGLVDFAKGALKVLSKVLEVAKGIADAITSILPGPLKFIGAAISAGIAAVDNYAVKAGAAMLDGMSAGAAFLAGTKEMAMDLLATVVSLVLPGGGGAAIAGAGAKAGATAGAKAAATEAAEQGAKAGATAGVKAGATAGTEASTSAAVKEGIKTGVKDEATAAAQDTAVTAVTT